MADLDQLGIGDDEEELRKRYAANASPGIARPNPPAATPPLTLRGIQPPAATSTMSPALKAQTEADTKKQGELAKGSGISQLKNPYARNGLRGLNIAGELASAVIPQVGTALRAIPGTEEHHNMLVNRNRGAIAQDTQEAEREAGTQHTQAETAAIPAETALKEAQAEKALHPTPEKPEDLQHELADATQEALAAGRDPNTDPKVKQISDVITSLQKQSQPKTPNDFEQFYGDWLKDNNLPDSAHNRLMARKEYAKAGQPFGQQHLDIALKNETRQENAQKDKQLAPYQQIIETASEAHNLKDMADAGNAPADVDLALAFFKTMRGQGGSIRFTQQEQKMILGARSTGQDLTALAQKVIGGGQPLTPDQRAKMVQVIDMHAKVAQQAMDRISGGGGGVAGPAATTKDFGAAPAGKPDGATGTLPDGTKVKVQGGRLVAQ